MRTKILISTFIFLLSIELSCGSDDKCKRECSKAVRNNDVIIEPLTDKESTLTCWENTTELSAKRKARFKVYTKDDSDKEVPRGYVLVTPRLDDGVGGSWISTEYDQEEHTGTDLKGIVTKSSDFCSDSCGVVEIEYALKCPGASEKERQATVKLEVSAGTSVAQYNTTVVQKANNE